MFSGHIQTLVLPKLRNFLMGALELPPTILSKIVGTVSLTKSYLDEMSTEVANAIFGILAEPVDRVVLQQALDDPGLLVEAEINQSPENVPNKSDQLWFMHPLEEMTKLRGMSGFIKVAHAQRRAAKGRHERHERQAC